ncbi:MAG: hypothetical protein GC184_11875 [Rhizobiales bacterium]|nr:hypothetical protein [Hyphomicrobiales bacterium]
MIVDFTNLVQGQKQKSKIFAEPLASPDQVLAAIVLLKPVATQHELIRLGSDGDGGYLVPDDLDGVTACFSPGVFDNASFELDVATRYHIPCHMADHSVDQAPLAHDLFDFDKKFVGTTTSDDFMDFSDWVGEKTRDNPAGDLLLQMDIEGGEWDVLINADEALLKRFRTMVIEFHGLNRLFAAGFANLYRSVFSKLTKHHYVLHAHPNNAGGMGRYAGIAVPRVLEVTLHRKDRCQLTRGDLNFPHRLDQKNNRRARAIDLPKMWY